MRSLALLPPFSFLVLASACLAPGPGTNAAPPAAPAAGASSDTLLGQADASMPPPRDPRPTQPPPPRDPPRASGGPDAEGPPPACAALGAACADSGVCCDSLCVDGVCAAACQPDGTECYWGGDCCSGACTYTGSTGYQPGSCIQALPNGSPCELDAWCQSGHCVDGTCQKAAACSAEGNQCWSGGECCSGICTYGWDYSPGKCIKPLPLGSFCWDASWCESGQCIDLACAVEGCETVEGSCWWEGDCCSGFCTYPGSGPYVPGRCAYKLYAGTSCQADTWCQTSACVDGVCNSMGKAGEACWATYMCASEVCQDGACQ